MTDIERQKILFLRKMSFDADCISKNMKIPVEDICDILGWPKDKEGRKRASKDYNFYEHGLSSSDNRCEFYSHFLQEGDFEKWQPVCYMDKTSAEFLNLKQEAQHIPKTDDHVKEARRCWILLRFPVYQKEEWGKINEQFKDHRMHIPDALADMQRLVREINRDF